MGLITLNTIPNLIFNVEKVNFSECDFIGETTVTRLTFKAFFFEKVYFGYTRFSNTKFQNCTFSHSSFSMAYFENCQFIDCKFIDISFSGNETLFINSQVDSDRMIKAGYTNLDKAVLESKGTTPEYQISRFEKTKAKFSKMLLNSLSNNTDDDLYYTAVKTHLLSRARSRIAKYEYDRNHLSPTKWKKITSYFKVKAAKIELYILIISGFINNWGNGLLRSIMFGIGIILLFSAYYWLEFGTSIIGAFIKSIDITLLAGYTKHVTKDTPTLAQCIMLSNMIFGLWWYAIVIPTLINRICTIRQ